MKEIEINEVAKYLDEAPNEMPLLFIGDTGIGKTQVISEYAKNRGYYFKSLVLSQLRPDEALGIPVRKTKEFQGREIETLTTAVPEWVLELAEQEKAILFLDELLTAKPDVMNSFLNFITERNVNGIDLSHIKIVTATNIGKYTFEPDENVLSRFCKFYTVNKTYKKYINDDRIFNDYEDETDKDHIVFDERSLKPRCQYWLSLIRNEFLPDFYEGFTNRPMGKVFSPNDKLNRFLNNIYREQGQESNFLHINENNVGLFIQFIKKQFPRLKNSRSMIEKMSNVKFDIGNTQQEVEEYINFRLKS